MHTLTNRNKKIQHFVQIPYDRHFKGEKEIINSVLLHSLFVESTVLYRRIGTSFSNMGSWACGPGMIQAPELEEGEACYYKDDTRTNPDVALSYIGDRVQSLLGHFQKDFEGGVSAENLGAKFGGYGSFLPMHQRSPLVPSQPKSSHKVQNCRGPRFSDTFLQEGTAPNSTQLSDAPATQRNDFSSSSTSIVPSRNFKVSSKDRSIKEKTSVSSHKDAEAFTGKAEVPPSKSDNPTEQRTLKVRLKLGSEMVAQYNAEINNLGLTSPSSSTEVSPEESARLRLEHCETPYESPAKILQIMTSFLVSGGSLLSPLCEDFLSLGRDTESSTRSGNKTNPRSSAISLGFENKDILKEKNEKSAVKFGNFEKSENERIPYLKDLKKETSGSETLGCRLQPLNGLNGRPLSDAVCSTNDPQKEAVRPPDVVRVSEMDVPPDNVRGFEKDVPLKKRKGSKDRLNERSVSSVLVENASIGCTPTQSYSKSDQKESRCGDGHKFGEDQTRVSENDISVNHGQDSRNRVKACSDVSDCESVKVAMNKSILKVGMKVKSGEQEPKATQNSAKLASKSAVILKNGGCAAPKVKNSGKKRNLVNLNQKDVLDTSIEHKDNSNHVLERPSGDRLKNSNLDAVKEENGYADKFKGRSSNKKYTDKITSETHVIEPPAEAIPFKEGIINATEGTTVDPVLIKENWVCCDHCEAWRLLPHGTESEQLPDKWVCSMLNWLPGMNSCDVSEDDTTNAVRASLSVPVPEKHYNDEAYADTSVPGVASVGAHHFTPNHQNFTSDKMACQSKRQNLKESSNSVCMSCPVPSNDDQKNFQHHSMNIINLKEVNQPLAGPEATKGCKLQHSKKSAISLGKLNKRKDENMREDFENPKKRIERESFQHVQGTMKKIKSKGALNVDNFQVSGGNLDLVDHDLNSDLPRKEPVKEEKRLSLRKDSSFREKGSVHIHVKKQKDQIQDFTYGELFDINASNRKEVSTKKRKFNREHREEAQQSIKKEKRDIDFHGVQKFRVSQIDNGFKRSKGGDSSKRQVAKARVILSSSNEKSTNSVVKEKQQSKNLKVKLSLTKEDIDELRKDLCCEEFSMAATSSCSKISDSRKNRVGFMEVKSSPEESVSSSPMRMPYLNRVLPVTLESAGKVGSRVNEFSAMGSGKKSLGMNRNSELGITRKGKTTGVRHVELLKNSAGFRERTAAETLCGEHISSGNLPCEFLETPLVDNKCSVLEQCGQCSPSLLVNCIHRKEEMSMDLSKALSAQQNSGKRNRTHGERSAEKVSDPSTGSEIFELKEKLKEETDIDDNYHVHSEVLSNVKHSFSDESSIKSVHRGKSAALETSLENENISNLPLSAALKEAQDALKKAEELKSHANLIKTSGFDSESNYEYLKAAVKFLHGASLLEAYNGGSIKNLETNLIQIYGTAAKLCETCAYEYEKSCELAAAALAYKCVEVAYLKIVYCKSKSTHRIWRYLQSSMQMLPQGESPSSSASDVDNLNNLVVADRAASSKGNDSHSLNHVMVPHNRTNISRLLDFTKDVNYAMEAAKKSLDTYKAAHVKFEESQNKEAIASVKRVIDFSFHDVEELINSVWLAFNAINRQAPSRARE
ncbi:cysteine-tryptophan domain-containing zinc finger protein 3-like isoform X2 [Primulina tabacum]|uniref:cysteine-tryptophan domain-containing zinc finger protein 3-like isoform X2 n=1 Tax=Primulina tabacum TaxID=48773 RepID=UPI003F597679